MARRRLIRCFPAATSVMMSGGTRKTTTDIKVGDVDFADSSTPGFLSWRAGVV